MAEGDQQEPERIGRFLGKNGVFGVAVGQHQSMHDKVCQVGCDGPRQSGNHDSGPVHASLLSVSSSARIMHRFSSRSAESAQHSQDE